MKDNSNITPELLETVERYYNCTMAKEERIGFEEQIQNDPAFKIVVDDIRTTLLGIEKQSLKEQLEEYHKDIPKKNPFVKPTIKARSLNFFKIAIAAGIIIALGVFWFLGGSSNDQLYAKHFKPDPGLPTTMSSSDNFVFYDAMVNYKQGQYAKAILKWKKLEQKSPDNDTINYFLGVAYLADKNAEKAIPYLNKTLNNTESVFLEDAYYYLGLAYLKSDKTEEAIQAFQKSHSEKSQDILKSLE